MTRPVPKTRSSRRARGAYFTPQPVVRYIVRQTLDPLLHAADPDRPLRILEPACGEGVFLVEAYRYLLAWSLDRYQKNPDCYAVGPKRRLEKNKAGEWRLTFEERKRILFASLFGLDQVANCVEAAKSALAKAAADGDLRRTDSLAKRLGTNIRCGDALIGPDFRAKDEEHRTTSPFSWEDSFRHVLNSPTGGFDAVIGNPPYVNIRVLTKSRGKVVKDYLKSHYRCACGSYDLYVLFLEKASQLLRTGGICGLIVPNRIATMDYARPCRSLLLERTTVTCITDISQCSAFPDAGVYPYIIIWKKQRPSRRHRIAVFHAGSTDDLACDRTTLHVRQADLSAENGLTIHGSLNVESRTTTRPLGELAELHSGTTGFAASKVAADLREQSTDRSKDRFDFIVSGNIDRYVVRLGDVRFMKRKFVRPVLPAKSACLTDRKRELFQDPKIVIAGMTRRLEAAYDPGGLALGVQVYAVAKPTEDTRYLLALLNSRLLSYLFRIRFQAKHLAGRYLAINKGPLERLPIRIVESADQRDRGRRKRLVELADAMQEMSQERPLRNSERTERESVFRQLESVDREIDGIVYQLYRLTDSEIETVESSFTERDNKLV
jgi:hypothetical protein